MSSSLKHAFPTSFPTAVEERFIDLLLCSEEDFPARFAAWKEDMVLDDVDHATLGLLPLLHKRLSRAGIDDQIAARLAGVYKVAWVKNQLLLKEVREVVKACAAVGVPVILLKGLSLILGVYRDVGARFLADGDILVRPEHARAVIEIMMKKGWKPVDIGLLSGVETFSFGSVTHAFNFSKEPDSTIELHWHLFHVADTVSTWKLFALRDLPSLNDADVWAWKHAVAVDQGGFSYRRTSYETMLVHVISHGADENSWRPFRWVVDAAWIVRTQKLDWDTVIEAAVAMDRTLDMKLGCRYLSERPGVVFPPGFLSRLEALPVSAREVRDHQRRVSGHLRPIGNFPALWYRYWKHESTGRLLNDVVAFPRYLAQVWGLPDHRALPRFVLEKYRDRWRQWRKQA